MIEFGKRILFVGFGSVAHCTLPVLLKHIRAKPQNITVLDFENLTESMKEWTAQGIRFQQERITPQNLGAVLGKYLSEGDLLIDLAWNIDCRTIVGWCHDHGVLYVNTSVEVWDPYEPAALAHPTQRTLYHRHMQLRALRSEWKERGPTAVLEHGANPGLISHFTKQALLDIGYRTLEDDRVTGAAAEELAQLLADRTYNQLAQQLGVKVIHCSERDTQIANRPKQVDEFVNTWSIEGLREEGTTTSEMGWGTHEKELPPHAYQHETGPRNQICLAQMGLNTWVRSWVPDYTIRGMVIRHGEAFSISDRLTVWDGDRAVYRPTVHYAYCPCNDAIASLNELRGYDYKLQPKLRILRDEIVRGADILGALVMGHSYHS
ncbi:MAG TPA: saccharopine dehydrogenase NADP-binding domain-containing protein, partial [Pirellulales bacterium]|nr:saccharopine dehydrogenase NADP-binding domain-containing protein [Pirellulales bacterium]